jgi:hypothetical protein
VYYDPVDLKIYELEDTPDDLRELSMDRALTMALLDQHYDWSTQVVELEPAARAAVLALFDGDAVSTARAIVDPSEADEADLRDQIDGLLADHAEDSVGAPRFAVDLVSGTGGVSTLFDLVDRADGVQGRDELLRSKVRTDAGLYDVTRGVEYRPEDLGGATDQTRGLMYWYYVLAGRIPSADAWDASLAWDGDSVVVSETANGVCVESTIATVDEVGRLRLLDALQRWAAGAPLESATAVTEIGTEQISVFACDPGAEADSVTNEVIAPFGESAVELEVVDQLRATSVDQQACVINAVRGFDVPGIIATGETAQIEPALAGIGEACVG